MERISGPRTGSTFGNLSKGNTASLAPWWLNFLSLSLRSSSLAPSIRRVARRAICVLQTLETRGTVRLARGFASRTNTLPSSMAYCMFMRPQNHTRREQRKCLHFHCRAVWVSENVERFRNLVGINLDGREVLTPSASAAAPRS